MLAVELSQRGVREGHCPLTVLLLQECCSSCCYNAVVTEVLFNTLLQYCYYNRPVHRQCCCNNRAVYCAVTALFSVVELLKWCFYNRAGPQCCI
jgi:hypothetical protein